MNNIPPINFWGMKQEYFVFSNFYHAPFTCSQMKYWATTEHYYQAQKFLDEDLQEQCRMMEGPRAAADFGRRTDLEIRFDWEEAKEAIMLQALSYKFYQHKDLRQLLISTGDRMIVEDSPIDYYWGCGKDRSGQNRLGVLLMCLRWEMGHNNFIVSTDKPNPYMNYEWSE
jgi:ribA/ribD-fused uncharacterized protein